MHYLPGARRVAGFLLIGVLAGCSGGGGDEATRTEISTNAITFRAATLDATVPAQTFTATFGEDIAHLAVVHSGAAITSATSVLNGRTAQITVTPAAANTIGPGAFVGAVAVTGYTCADATCTRLSAGSSATVSVNYQVSPVIQRVAPYVAVANTTDTVLIGGLGFRNFNVNGVRFGDTPAINIDTNNINSSGTEIAATHGPLPAGTYPVRLMAPDHDGEIPTSVNLVVVDPVAYAATTLAHPSGASVVRSLSYDFERRALLVVTDAASGPLARYAYENGAWSTPTQATAALLDAALTATGSQIFGITSTTLVPIDPVTLALGTAVSAPSLETNSALKNIVVGNDNRALITTSLTTSGTTPGYIYDPGTNAVLLIASPELNNGTPVMAANGSAAVIVQGDPTLTSDVAVYKYLTAGNQLSSAGTPTLRQNTVPPAIDRSVTRVVLNGLRVYDGAFAFLGTLPTTTAAVVLKPNGKRAYAYDPTAGGIVVYDVSVDRDEAAYAPLGAAVPLVGDPGTGVRMAITPDGGTLFVAGSSQIVVQPTPAL
ncbi:MAG TPA: IPT/TIG domain-containing protein [Steroidobacter sp.]|uniref:IPT/TIG domain-containing protein n=1 Tax=Steroidobacter sp. TaxID=1978227 RepID=UPI002ED9D005